MSPPLKLQLLGGTHHVIFPATPLYRTIAVWAKTLEAVTFLGLWLESARSYLEVSCTCLKVILKVETPSKCTWQRAQYPTRVRGNNASVASRASFSAAPLRTENQKKIIRRTSSAPSVVSKSLVFSTKGITSCDVFFHDFLCAGGF